MSLKEENKTCRAKDFAAMSPSLRWYYKNKAKNEEKHRAYQRQYLSLHREYYRQKSREYYLKNKEKLANREKPKIEPGLPDRLRYDGIMLLLAAVIEQAKRDIKEYEHRLESPSKRRLSGDKVSYRDYLTAVNFIEKELPEWEELYSFKF